MIKHLLLKIKILYKINIKKTCLFSNPNTFSTHIFLKKNSIILKDKLGN